MCDGSICSQALWVSFGAPVEHEYSEALDDAAFSGMRRLAGGDVPASRACPQLPPPERRPTKQCAAAAAQGVTMTRQAVVETPRVRRFVCWSFVLGQPACVRYVLEPAVAARLFAIAIPGASAWRFYSCHRRIVVPTKNE